MLCTDKESCIDVLAELIDLHSVLEGDRPDVAEIYSPPRVTKEAGRMNLRPGFALDLTVPNEAGEMWDFTRQDMRQEARRRVMTERPKLLIGCPPCTLYSQLQALVMNSRDPAVSPSLAGTRSRTR